MNTNALACQESLAVVWVKGVSVGARNVSKPSLSRLHFNLVLGPQCFGYSKNGRRMGGEWQGSLGGI